MSYSLAFTEIDDILESKCTEISLEEYSLIRKKIIDCRIKKVMFDKNQEDSQLVVDFVKAANYEVVDVLYNSQEKEISEEDLKDEV